jgi:hypothetical protein
MTLTSLQATEHQSIGEKKIIVLCDPDDRANSLPYVAPLDSYGIKFDLQAEDDLGTSDVATSPTPSAVISFWSDKVAYRATGFPKHIEYLRKRIPFVVVGRGDAMVPPALRAAGMSRYYFLPHVSRANKLAEGVRDWHVLDATPAVSPTLCMELDHRVITPTSCSQEYVFHTEQCTTADTIRVRARFSALGHSAEADDAVRLTRSLSDADYELIANEARAFRKLIEEGCEAKLLLCLPDALDMDGYSSFRLRKLVDFLEHTWKDLRGLRIAFLDSGNAGTHVGTSYYMLGDKVLLSGTSRGRGDEYDEMQVVYNRETLLSARQEFDTLFERQYRSISDEVGASEDRIRQTVIEKLRALLKRVPVPKPITDPQVAEVLMRGAARFQELRPTLEQQHFGEVVVIDTRTGEYEVDVVLEEARKRLLERLPDARGYVYTARFSTEPVHSLGIQR